MPLLVRWAEEIVYKLKADAIVACGHSGLVLAGAVSYVTRVPVIAVRKRGEPVVAGGDAAPKVSTALGNPAKRWIWLDDFISSGGTFRNSVSELMKAHVVESAIPAGILHYASGQRGIDSDPTSSHSLGFPSRSVPEFGFKK